MTAFTDHKTFTIDGDSLELELYATIKTKDRNRASKQLHRALESAEIDGYTHITIISNDNGHKAVYVGN